MNAKDVLIEMKLFLGLFEKQEDTDVDNIILPTVEAESALARQNGEKDKLVHTMAKALCSGKPQKGVELMPNSTED